MASTFSDATWQKLLRKTADHVVSQAEIDRHALPADVDVDMISVQKLRQFMWHNEIEKSRLFEHYCTLCRAGTGDVTLRFCGDSDTPNACVVAGKCGHGAGGKTRRTFGGKERTEFLGTFHTHPVGPALPSIADLECTRSRSEPMFVIGAHDGDDAVVRVFKPKSTTNPLRSYLNLETLMRLERTLGAAGTPALHEPMLDTRALPYTKGPREIGIIHVPSVDAERKWERAWLDEIRKWFDIEERRTPLK